MKFYLFFLFLTSAWAAPSPLLVAPLLLDQQNLGDVWVYKNVDFEFGKEGLVAALEKALIPSEWPKLKTLPNLVTIAELKGRGIIIRFDEAALVLHLQVERAIRSKRLLKIRGIHEENQELIGPSAFSGYLNFTGSQGFDYPKSQARQAFRGQLDLTTNFRGFVLETGQLYTERDPYVWRRQDTRITRDFEEYILRASAGDFTPAVQSYQNSRPLGGLAFSRQFSIQPYLNTRPLNKTEINIQRPSIIEVYVNDGFVNRSSVPAGPLELSEFPLFSGVNKVDLKIIDDTGKIEWVNLNLLYDVQLLGEGIHQFSYQAGLPSESYKSDRRYDSKNLTFSAFHRLGLNDQLTAGLSFQNDQSSWMLGHDIIVLTKAGTISGEFALSRRYQSVSAGAGKLRYKSLDYKLGNDRPWRGAAEMEYKARLFTAIGQENTQNLFSWRYDLSVSKPITATMNLGFGAQWNVNRVGSSDRKSLRTDFTTNLGPQWKANLNYTIERENKINHRIFVGISWVEKSGKYYGNASYDYPSKTTRVEGTRSPSTQVGDYRATLGAQNSPKELRADFLGEYTHEKGNLRLEQTSTRTKSTETSAHSTTITASTALAWAGSKLAVTRPVSDSFAILAAKKNFKKFEIPVNVINGMPETVVNRFGAGVIPTLTSYSNTAIALDGTDIPLGYSLGQEHRVVRPTYKSGIFLPVGGDATAMIVGKLKKSDGSGLSLMAGEIKSQEKIVGSFFTNREGKYIIEGLAPGTYTLEVDSYQKIEISILNDQVGIVHIPDQSMKRGN